MSGIGKPMPRYGCCFHHRSAPEPSSVARRYRWKGGAAGQPPGSFGLRRRRRRARGFSVSVIFWSRVSQFRCADEQLFQFRNKLRSELSQFWCADGILFLCRNTSEEFLFLRSRIQVNSSGCLKRNLNEPSDPFSALARALLLIFGDETLGGLDRQA